MFADSAGRLILDNELFYGLTPHVPQQVLISNADGEFPYLSDDQVQDRVLTLYLKHPWVGAEVPVRLRLIDPPDLAPYDSKDLDDPADFAAFPYEANDNHVLLADCVAAGECGLSLAPDGANPALELMVTPPGPVYLKIPDDVSGENFQVEISKVNPATSQVYPNRVLTLSPVFTSWKRVFVERDRMFRGGGVLAEDYIPEEDCGTPANPICDCVADPTADCCNGIGPVFCNQIVAYEWQNAAADDQVAVFDTHHSYENGGETRRITFVAPAADSHGLLYVTLDQGLAQGYLSSSRQEPAPPATYEPDFQNHESAGYGVISACDASSNQINASDSCFYKADLRRVEQAYNDAFVEVFAPRDGMGAVPYVSQGSGVLDATNVIVSGHFSRIWFKQFIPANGDEPEAVAHNYFHMTGIASNLSTASGWSWAEYDMIMIATGWIYDVWGEFPEYVRQAAAHELGHMFRVNPISCDPDNHDDNFAWCGGEGGDCAVAPLTHERCVMYENKSDPEWFALIQNDVNRFCCINLSGPVAGQHCQNRSCAEEDGIRNHPDPE